MPVTVRGSEGLDRRRLVIIGEDAGDGVDEHALAVGALAVEEEQRVLGRDAGEAVADNALQERLQLLVAGRHPVEEGVPRGALAAGGHRREARDVILGGVRALHACPQVNDVIRRIQQPRIGVPLIDRSGMHPIGLGQHDYGGDRLRGDELLGRGGIFCCRHSTANSRQILRARSNTCLVSSTSQRVLSHRSHLFHAAQ